MYRGGGNARKQVERRKVKKLIARIYKAIVEQYYAPDDHTYLENCMNYKEDVEALMKKKKKSLGGDGETPRKKKAVEVTPMTVPKIPAPLPEHPANKERYDSLIDKIRTRNEDVELETIATALNLPIPNSEKQSSNVLERDLMEEDEDEDSVARPVAIPKVATPPKKRLWNPRTMKKNPKERPLTNRKSYRWTPKRTCRTTNRNQSRLHLKK